MAVLVSSINMRSKAFIWAVVFIEAVLVLFYSLFVRFEDAANLETYGKQEFEDRANHQLDIYPLFQHISVMIFVGFAFNMSFLKYHNWNSISLNFLVGAFGLQLYIVFYGFWFALIKDDWENYVEISISKLVGAQYCVAGILISFGALLGKVNALQILVLTVVESLVYTLNEVIVVQELKAIDYGGSFVFHAFGAFFGVAAAWIVSPPSTKNHPHNQTSHKGMVYTAIGTMFLWMFWPSANTAGIQNPQERYLGILNTILALTGSTMTTFATSAALNSGKFKMQNILNASLAGGVLVGSSCNFILYPGVSLAIGILAGCITTVGFERVNLYFVEKLKLYDTCGVLYLHGFPGVLSGVISSLIIATRENTDLKEATFGIEDSFNEQAVNQLLAVLVTFGISIVFGAISAYIIKAEVFSEQKLFVDDPDWTEAKSPKPEGYELPVTATEKNRA